MNFYIRAKWEGGKWRVWLRLGQREFEVTWALPFLKRFLPKDKPANSAPGAPGSATPEHDLPEREPSERDGRDR